MTRNDPKSVIHFYGNLKARLQKEAKRQDRSLTWLVNHLCSTHPEMKDKKRK